jgi:hypothetical protein
MGTLHQKVGTVGIGVSPERAAGVDLVSLLNSSTRLENAM